MNPGKAVVNSEVLPAPAGSEMNTLMGMGLLGLLLSLLAGLVLGGLFLFSIRLQVEYVMKKGGRLWVVPACLYARLALMAVILILVAVLLPGEKVAGAMLAGAVGVFIARICVSRQVRRQDATEPKQEEDR
ncbi:MAG: hypothetical protein HQ559_08595 [Lentisphaerae bacterium]|nr:hypothetical protein [Lentisphaerota bacterium]